MPFANKKKAKRYKVWSAQRAKLRVMSELRPGESLMFHCWDMARCECPSGMIRCQVAVIPVGISGRGRDKTCRCFACDATWPLPEPGQRRADRVAA